MWQGLTDSTSHVRAVFHVETRIGDLGRGEGIEMLVSDPMMLVMAINRIISA